jgi:glyoxylase-like metal-dependent hydrolase (beta-lactamase superfamily II)
VAAIRVEALAERRHRALDKQSVENSWTAEDEKLARLMGLSDKSGLEKPFPRPFLEPHRVPNVYWLGHHNDASFGAVPYLLRASVNSKTIWIMVDSPRFSSSSVKAITSLTGPVGPDYHFLTHVDDTADHVKWVSEFPKLKRIFHSGDLGRYNWLRDETLESVEILLPRVSSTKNEFLTAYSLDGDLLDEDWVTSTDIESHPVVILHTPGHSPGSITLYKRPTQGRDKEPGILFTGDTYAWTTRDGGRMTGFPRHGNSLSQQHETLQHFLQLEWDVIAPGHGHSRDYRGIDKKKEVQSQELRVAQEELQSSSARRW